MTSACHMPRAIGVFRKAGFPIEAYPVDWYPRGDEDALRPFATIGGGLQRTDTAVHEWSASQPTGSRGAARSCFQRQLRRRLNQLPNKQSRSAACITPPFARK